MSWLLKRDVTFPITFVKCVKHNDILAYVVIFLKSVLPNLISIFLLHKLYSKTRSKIMHIFLRTLTTNFVHSIHVAPMQTQFGRSCPHHMKGRGGVL
jgi:hypothetical protein